MSSLRDLSKIGVLLIGVALIIIAGIAIHFYITFIQKLPPPSPPAPFYTHCEDRTLIIHADREIRDVRVLDNRSNQVCFFGRIPAGSDEICPVKEHGIYVVQGGEYKRVVRCLEIRTASLD